RAPAPRPVLRPGQPYPDARRAIDAGAAVALATNCNPGSSYTTSMAFCIALAVREMGMTIEEALLAATVGGASALRRDDVGLLAPGARADAAILTAPTYAHLVYRPGEPIVAAALVGGELRPRAASRAASRGRSPPAGSRSSPRRSG